MAKFWASKSEYLNMNRRSAMKCLGAGGAASVVAGTGLEGALFVQTAPSREQAEVREPQGPGRDSAGFRPGSSRIVSRVLGWEASPELYLGCRSRASHRTSWLAWTTFCSLIDTRLLMTTITMRWSRSTVSNATALE